MNVAIIAGGSERVWSDLSNAGDFCRDHGLTPTYYAANDMIEQYHEPCVAVTLHPDKLYVWLKQRANAGRPAVEQVWSHTGGDSRSRPNPHVTHRLKDWGGSVGMFGYQVARERGHDHVILCGVPMTTDNHFVRKARWSAQPAFARAWENHKAEMSPYVRSMSGGWTEELFGLPTQDWIKGESQ